VILQQIFTDVSRNIQIQTILFMYNYRRSYTL